MSIDSPPERQPGRYWFDQIHRDARLLADSLRSFADDLDAAQGASICLTAEHGLDVDAVCELTDELAAMFPKLHERIATVARGVYGAQTGYLITTRVER